MANDLKIDLRLIGMFDAVPACRVRDDCAPVLQVPFDYARGESTRAPKIGVFVHIFYPELCEEIISYLNNIEFSFDVYVSTCKIEDKIIIEEAFTRCRANRFVVTVFPNKGRDISSLIVGYADEVQQYDLVLHIHSKKSPHNSELEGWREYSLRQLVGSSETVNSIVDCLTFSDVGLIFPDHYSPVRKSLNFGHNFPLMRKLLERVDICLSKDMLLDFPSGSFFWATRSVVRQALKLNVRYEDFPEERGQIDGTLAHALERSWVYLAEAAGCRWLRIVTSTDCEFPDQLFSVHSRPDLASAVTRVCRRITEGRTSVDFARRSYDELSVLQCRAEISSKPRFSLLVPTLQPSKMFGGMATALRVFEAIAAELGTGWDCRIVSLTDSVGLEEMSSVPKYTLVQLDSDPTAVRCTVVDGSSLRSGQLGVRRHEIFMATAWWTALAGFRFIDFQRRLFRVSIPMIYLIQDHEPDFYGWSSRFALAHSSYQRLADIIPILNSEELYNFFEREYGVNGGFVLPYAPNEAVRSAFRSVERKRKVIVYGRPSVPRNAFALAMDAICLWQQSSPTIANEWEVVSVGEVFEPHLADGVANLTILGKLSLFDYAELLCESLVGVSLMLSPHPSYPPLEMAEAGLYTVTNSFKNKDLSKRSRKLLTQRSLAPGDLSVAIGDAVFQAVPFVNSKIEFEKIEKIPCNGLEFSPAKVVSEIRRMLGSVLSEPDLRRLLFDAP